MKKIFALLCVCIMLTALSGAVFPVEKAGDELVGILICSCPEHGTLKLDGTAVKTGQAVTAADLEKLDYTAGSREVDHFSYVEVYRSGKISDEMECILSGEYNTAPQAMPCTIKTMRGLTSCAVLRAHDDQADALEYKILTFPQKGKVDIIDGEFVYTPYIGKYGDDSFTFIVRDEFGAWSNEAEVSVEISRRDPTVNYADMEGNAAQYAAACLAEEDIYIGSSIGGVCRFEPEATLTRGEFASMALCAAGIEPAVCASTAFDDDGTIPAWSRGYICEAASLGLIAGSMGEHGQIEFHAEDEASVAFASAVIERILGGESRGGDWISAAVSGLEERGILGALANCSPDEALTRAAAAILLCRASDYLQKQSELGMFGWTAA